MMHQERKFESSTVVITGLSRTMRMISGSSFLTKAIGEPMTAYCYTPYYGTSPGCYFLSSVVPASRYHAKLFLTCEKFGECFYPKTLAGMIPFMIKSFELFVP